MNGASFFIDQFLLFSGMVKISGWIWDARRKLVNLSLRTPAEDDLVVADIHLPSNDVANAIDRRATHVRFVGRWLSEIATTKLLTARLIATFDDNTEFAIERFAATNLAHDPCHQQMQNFWSLLGQSDSGSLLEVGSRARSGISRRQSVPSTWRYTGLDIMAGENVDVVGDAHQLSRLFAPGSFRAVMSFSVLEHLLMPWKFAVELNRVMELGGFGFFMTHQCWPVHDQPWDFWRFSSEAWKGIFNRATGFEIVRAEMGELGFVVANCCHTITNFRESPVYLLSTVLVRKINETTLNWDAELDEILTNSYPAGTTKVDL
ncbi:MAG: methyltransferase domain-containing protein [Proteobacteria bacterium]|nr:methyltransferase domain-containing protein [Pseudomonadota bacterium]